MDAALELPRHPFDDAEIELDAEAEVNRDIVASFDEDLMPDAISALLPELRTTFVLDWTFTPDLDFNGELDIGDASSLHLLAFNDVVVDLGSFLGDFLGSQTWQARTSRL